MSTAWPIEVNAAEASTTNAHVGVPHVLPQDAQVTRHRGPIPAEYPKTVRDAAVQTDDPVQLPAPTWEELRAGLERARALDQTAHRMRAEAFEALERYAGMTAEPHPEAAYWRKLATAKADETEHLVAWRAERSARLLRERADEEAKLRAASEKALGEARARRRAEEAELQAARARWEEARRDEERAAAELSLAQPRPQTQPQMPPGAGRLRYCYVCRWPGIRVSRKCPNGAAYPPKPDESPRG